MKSLDGLDISRNAVHEVLYFDNEEWAQEIPRIRQFYQKYGQRLPNIFYELVNTMEKQLKLEEHEPPTHNKVTFSFMIASFYNTYEGIIAMG